MLQLHNFSVPVICGVRGVAAAAGFQLAMACDMIIATEKSMFSCPGIKLGLFCSTPGVELIRSINSEKKAKEILCFGEEMDAREAYHYGIVNKVVP
jgi:enoyl-CoA hydratase/carnithine racemase